MGKIPNFNCEICNKPVYRNPNNPPEHITCSKECRSKLIKQMHGKYIKCDMCGIEFYKKNSRLSHNNFCSDKCARQFYKPKLTDEQILQYHLDGKYDYEIAQIAQCSREEITVILNRLGFQQRRTKINDKDLRLRISNSNKGKRTGGDNHKYKGKSSFTDMARGLFSSISKTYMLNHDYTCEICNKRGGDLNTHHIKPFALILDEFLEKHPDISKDEFSKLILEYLDFTDEKNLILVCKSCHDNIHNGDDPELSPYRWESATTIENTNQPKAKNKVG